MSYHFEFQFIDISMKLGKFCTLRIFVFVPKCSTGKALCESDRTSFVPCCIVITFLPQNEQKEESCYNEEVSCEDFKDRLILLQKEINKRKYSFIYLRTLSRF